LVRTFISEPWTLEFALANSGLHKELALAIAWAKAERKEDGGGGFHGGNKCTWVRKETRKILKRAEEYAAENPGERGERLATKVYEPLVKRQASKAVAAQYLARILEKRYRKKLDELRQKLPPALIDAIEYVTPARTRDQE
jgi:putative ATP-dependent endonuclease of OLD family